MASWKFCNCTGPAEANVINLYQVSMGLKYCMASWKFCRCTGPTKANVINSYQVGIYGPKILYVWILGSSATASDLIGANVINSDQILIAPKDDMRRQVM
jgi:hypothetical protein